MRITKRVLQLALVTFFVCAACVSANPPREVTVTLRTGETVEGTLIEETRSTLIVETLLHNIPYKKTVRRGDISEIEYREAEAPRVVSEEPPDSTVAPGEADSEWVPPTRYLVIPIHGQIGIDSLDNPPLAVTARAIEDALQYAARKKIEHVVFTLDTPGGYTREAKEIANTIKRYKGRITFHALVHRSISAGMRLTYSCDHIWFLPDAAAGGALSYRVSGEGMIEYDAKQNSIAAADLAALAESNGHNPAIAAAMVLPERVVYAWDDSTGGVRAGVTPPADSDARIIDGPQTVLTLAGSRAVELGVGRAVDGGHMGIGEQLGIEKWTMFGNRYGENIVKRAFDDITAAERRHRDGMAGHTESVDIAASALPTIQVSLSAARRVDPQYQSYSYDSNTGAMTAHSRRRWQQKTDEAIGLWQRALSQIEEIESARADAARALEQNDRREAYWAFVESNKVLGVELRESIDRLDELRPWLSAWKQDAQTILSRLRRERDKAYR